MPIADFSNAPLTDILSLRGRRAVVTGGGQGMGAGIVARLAEAGVSVAIGDLDHVAAAQTSEEISGRDGATVHAFPLDVASEASIIAYADAAMEAMGGIDIWVNVVGYYPHDTIIEMETEVWEKVQDINLRAVFISTREAAKRMTSCGSQHGVIINIASLAGLRAWTGMSHYVAAKHGVLGFTKAAALELGPLNIRVMAIAPSLILTSVTQAMTPEAIQHQVANYPLGRAGVPDDIARAVLFCASDLSAFMTGSTLPLDAGYYAGVFRAASDN